MGDVILASVVPRYLRWRYPDAHIRLVTDGLYAPLFHDDPNVNLVVAYDRDNPAKALGMCREDSWDLVVDLQRNRRSAALVRSIGTVRTHRRLHKRRLSRAALLLLRIDTYPGNDSVVARYLAAAGMDDGGGGAWLPRIWLKREEDTEFEGLQGVMADLDSSRPCLAMVPFTAWRNKTWPLARFETVGGHFMRLGWNVVILGGPRDREYGAAMQRRLGPGSVSLAGRVSLRQSAHALTRCRLAFGGDTGLMHLARSVGVRVAIVYGATARQFGFYPCGAPPFRILETSLGCRPCHPHGGHVCMRLGKRTCPP